MNKQAMKLLSILAACQPEDKQLVCEARIQAIIHSEPYAELQHRSAFAKLFNELFNEVKLRKYDDTQLQIVAEVLPLLLDCLNNIVFSLKNGGCPLLTSKDKPNFFDKRSLAALNSKMEDGSGKNYCNIEASDFMAIFEDSTIKSIKDYFLQLPVQCEDYEQEVATVLEGHKFCISEQEVRSYEEGYEMQLKRCQEVIEGGKDGRFWYLSLKVLLGLLCLCIPYFYGRYTGNIASDISGYCSVVVFICIVTYWVKG